MKEKISNNQMSRKEELLFSIYQRRTGFDQIPSHPERMTGHVDDLFYDIMVDYDIGLEASGQIYQFVGDITSKDYPPPKGGKHHTKITFLHFGEAMPLSISEMKEEIQKMNLCFVDPYHIIAFIKKYPEFELPYNIVALQTTRKDKYGSQNVLYWATDGHWSEYNLNYVSGDLLLYCLFACVPNE
jgi:hypothetical protein